MKRVFVSGGSGYIAMYCIKILISKGKLDIQIKAHLQKLSKRAEHAREKRAAVDTAPKTKHIEYRKIADGVHNLSGIQNYERKAAA